MMGDMARIGSAVEGKVVSQRIIFSRVIAKRNQLLFCIF